MLINTNKAHYIWFDNNTCSAKPLGSFDLFEHKDEPEKPLYLWSLEIINEYDRLKGYGQKMLSEIIQFANGKPVRLYVQRNNKIAIHIYQKAGFRIIGKYMGEEAWIMQHEGTYEDRCFVKEEREVAQC